MATHAAPPMSSSTPRRRARPRCAVQGRGIHDDQGAVHGAERCGRRHQVAAKRCAAIGRHRRRPRLEARQGAARRGGGGWCLAAPALRPIRLVQRTVSWCSGRFFGVGPARILATQIPSTCALHPHTE
eukprot:360114-Chlamydomonas_euryale.AAC.3